MSFFFVGLNPLYLSKKNIENEQTSFGQEFECFITKLIIFYTNPNDNLKNRYHSKVFLGHAGFKFCLDQIFP